MKNHQVLVFQNKLSVFQIKETLLVLTAAIAIPFLIHLIPLHDNVPWGARLLPMFYAPFIAIVFFRPHVGLIAALIAPFINALITGNPQPDKIVILTMELTIFTCTSYFIYSRLPNFKANTLISYLLAKAISWLLLLIIAAITFTPTFTTSLFTIKNAYPGIAILALINIFAVRLKDILT